MEESSLSYKTLRNSVYLFANFLVPMAFTVFVTRSMAMKLGPAEYGIFLLINAISAFINYVDLGLSTAVTKYAAEYQGSGNKKGLEDLLSSARLLFFVTGLLGVVIFFVLGRWFLPLFHIEVSSVPNIFVVFILAGVVFFFSSLTTVYAAALSALQRFDVLTRLNMFSLITSSIGTIILLNMHVRLKAVMGLNAIMALITLVLYHYFVFKLMPEVRLTFTLVTSELKKAYKFGLLAFSSNLAASCLIYLDRLFIPIFLGPAQLPFYSVPGNVAMKTSVVTNSFGQMLFPMASELQGADQMEKLKGVYIRAFRNLHIISAAVTVSIILFADKILFFWLGTEYAEKGSTILVVLALTYFVVALYIPLQGLLLGLGKLKFLIKQSIIMALLNLVLLIIFVPRFGIMGAAWAYLISVIPMGFAFFWTERNLFGLTGQFRRYGILYLKLIFAAILNTLIIKFLLLGLVHTVWGLLIVGPISVLLYFVIYYLFGFMEKEDTDVMKSFAYKFLRLKV